MNIYTFKTLKQLKGQYRHDQQDMELECLF